MKKFPIIAGVVCFGLGILVILTWFRFIHNWDNFYIPNFSPIKEDPLLSLTSHFLIPLIFIALGYGLYLHYRKKSFSLRIIAFFYSVVLVDNLYTTLSLLKEIAFPTKIELYTFEKILIKQPTLSDYLPILLSNLIYIVISAISLKIILPQLNTNKTKPSNKMKWTRLTNWAVDVMVISQILFGKLPFQWIKNISSNEAIMMWLVCAVHIILYYSFFEILYRRTPGKFLTNTSVVTSDNAKPSAFTILLRTILRLVPLEFISFLFAGNWHDRFSKTHVN